MESKKSKTIDEFFIEKYERLEEEIEVLKKEQEELFEMNYNLGEERDKWEEKYYELVEKIKKDFKIVLRYSTAYEGEKIITPDIILFEQHEKEKFDFYKELFNLKEEGEEENE